MTALTVRVVRADAAGAFGVVGVTVVAAEAVVVEADAAGVVEVGTGNGGAVGCCRRDGWWPGTL